MNSKEIKKGNYVMHKGEVYIVQDYSAENDRIKVNLQPLFKQNPKSVVIKLNESLEEADIRRKTASVLFKKQGNLEIMDSYDFTTHLVEVDPETHENAVEGDMVTYIKFNENIRILELRKS